ncbi:peptide deformylase [Massilia sp. CCM 8695]|uniref:Peptide deformylase n=2 Tax=Massilia TaxID=149698 RepID=A0ABX0N228_9BURK|nr:peptide deformylase [Massilia frigida]NHZ79368.1 peptide deformylase [Massilia frigida]
MTVRDILKMGDARLLRVAEPVREFGTPAMEALIADMFDTMHHANGAGLAAPQIGVNLQLVIFGFKDNQRYPDAPAVPQTVLINPVLTPLSDDKEEAFEGCLSVPGLRGSVPRFTQLRYEGVDQHGKRIVREVDGFHARVVQHEVDHLLGILYPMRIEDFTKFGYTQVMFPDLDPDDDD